MDRTDPIHQDIYSLKLQHRISGHVEVMLRVGSSLRPRRGNSNMMPYQNVSGDNAFVSSVD